ncbi:MAG: hypothetical protein JW837_08775 [Sedimentisphaerales bacterium]|nr:hypothetical protein [Sedimentisphaerales bacterium]
MRRDPVRFTSQWALIGVILFYTVGTTMIARHTKRIFRPASAGASERREYTHIDVPGPYLQDYWQNRIPGLRPWGTDGNSLTIFNDATFDARQFYQDINTVDLAPANTEKNNARQRPLRIRTSFKCIESILKKAVIVPYQVNGRIIGLQMNGLEKISQAVAALLMKSGDVILAVNGKPLSSEKEAYKIFKGVRKEPTMTVDILQDGEPKKIVLDLK